MPASIVDTNYRYVTAYQEVNARVVQRQQALALYVTLLVSLLAAIVALRPSNPATQVPIEWLILGFPISSICFAFLNYKAERTISNLRTFLSELEKLGDANLYLPSYNTDPKWSVGANKARRFHDYAVALLVAGGNLIGLGAAIGIYPQRTSENIVSVIVSIALALIAFAVLALTPRWSYSPSVNHLS